MEEDVPSGKWRMIDSSKPGEELRVEVGEAAFVPGWVLDYDEFGERAIFAYH